MSDRSYDLCSHRSGCRERPTKGSYPEGGMIPIRFFYGMGPDLTRHADPGAVAYLGRFTENEVKRGVPLEEWIKAPEAHGGFVARTIHGRTEPVRVDTLKPGDRALFALLSVDLLTLQVGEVLPT
jgi:hypothetical protein